MAQLSPSLLIFSFIFKENFCVSCLCFKTDQMTVVHRRELMERQKNMADLNNEKEIDFFSNMITDLRYVWQDKEVSEILARLVSQVGGLTDKGKILDKEAGRAPIKLSSMSPFIGLRKKNGILVSRIPDIF